MTKAAFTTVVADPPWQYRDKVGPGVGFGADRIRGRRGADGYYPTMPTDQICALGSNGLLAGHAIADDAHLYLWTTNAFLEDAHRVCRAWGFTPRTVLTWVKPQIGMGSYFRNNTEHVVFAVRGKLRLQVKNQPTSFTAPRTRIHSQKPEQFFEIVERCSPPSYLELFARRSRVGWTSWGNQVDVVFDEEKDMAKKRTAKPKKKPEPKRGKFAATTKAGKKAEQIAAARATKPKKANGKVTHEGGTGQRFPSRRVTVIAPNGSSSRDPLPDAAPLDLGPILLPEPDDAVKVLKELATLNDQAQQAKKVYEDLKDRTKTAKEKYDDLADMVLTRLRVTTHKSDLPLFDERTEDQTRMETAGKLVVAASTEPLGDDLPAGEESIPMTEEAASELLDDLEVPF